MLKIYSAVLPSLLVLAASCGAGKHLPAQSNTGTQVHSRDNLRILDSVRVRDSVVLVILPTEQSQALFQKFLPSHLETSLAMSDAWVDSLGLHHSLTNKRDSLAVRVPVKEYYHEREYTAASDSSSVQVNTVYVPVEKHLNVFQRFKLDAFWWLSASVLLLLAWCTRKIWLKLIKIV